MDTETFEDMALGRQQLGDMVSYLLENVVVDVLTYDGEPISVELPTTMEMRVVQTDPGFKGDTATGGTKPAIVETGLRVNVPLFVNEGELIRVDTRDATYIERVSER